MIPIYDAMPGFHDVHKVLTELKFGMTGLNSEFRDKRQSAFEFDGPVQSPLPHLLARLRFRPAASRRKTA